MSGPQTALALLLPLLTASGCGDKDDDTGEDAGEPTFTRVWSEVLQPSCTYSGCHSGTGSASLGWDDADGAYAALVGVESTQAAGVELVAAGDPDSSYLMWKLEDSAEIEGDFMPPDTALDADRLALVRAWIAAGAAND